MFLRWMQRRVVSRTDRVWTVERESVDEFGIYITRPSGERAILRDWFSRDALLALAENLRDALSDTESPDQDRGVPAP
jgi:hypothetical protein